MVTWTVEVRAILIQPLHVDQLCPSQVSNNDFGHLGCSSKCARPIEQNSRAMKMDGYVKASQVHFDFLILICNEVNLLHKYLLPLVFIRGWHICYPIFVHGSWDATRGSFEVNTCLTISPILLTLVIIYWVVEKGNLISLIICFATLDSSTSKYSYATSTMDMLFEIFATIQTP